MENKYYYRLLAFLLLLIPGWGYGETWQQTLEQKFDIVETFDNLQNWHGAKVPYCAIDPKLLPKREDGTLSHFTRYCNYYDTQVGDHIKDHGSQKQIGTKSLRLWHSGGLSYFGSYFGNGTPQSGYTDMYLFLRAYIPKTAFPTQVTGTYPNAVAEYIQGQPYIYWSSWKFVNINTGFTAPYKWNYVDPPNSYGDREVWLHLFYYPTSSSLSGTMQISKDGGGYMVIDGKQNAIAKYLDTLMGIEFHFKLESPAGSNNGVLEVWFYDTQGNSELLLQTNNVAFRPSTGEGHNFNMVQLEGNKHTASSYIYNCGASMECSFYLDDFIIDDNRIGPIYYNLLAPEPDTTPPSTPSGLQILN
jgi:hypothetical protein